MDSSRDLLLEIGAEELPASFVEVALRALPELAKKRLLALRLAHGDVRALGTPRRLTLLVSGLALLQPDLEETVQGPSASAAYDKEGKPTRAAESFAKKLGVALEDLRTVETPKGKYLAGTRREKGRPATDLLGDMLTALLGEIPFRKSMRWGSRDETFGRPIRWLLALLGSDVVPFSYAGITSDRITFGHRFLAPSPISLPDSTRYVETLSAAHVMVDPKSRESLMRERLHAGAAEAGGAMIEDEFLMGENLSLVEEPHVVVGSFEPRFLALPEQVILEVARGHQRYFGVRSAGGQLLPRYLAVANTAIRPELIIRGNDRVMRARLSDAQFFFEEDMKTQLSSRFDKLGGIVFHNRLGSVKDKAVRVSRLVTALGALAAIPGVDLALAKQGAELAKCDLVTLMVGEFPDLQGVMGRAYALANGVPERAANVIAEHYQPKGARDDVAASKEGALVALADRLDTLVACFAIGLAPTGAADPFALRRACLGVLRTLLHHGWDVSLGELIALAYAHLDGIKLDLDAAATSAKLSDFFRERLRHSLGDELPADVVDACLAVASDRPLDARARASALVKLEPDVRARVGEVFKRVANIAKEAPDGEPVAPKEREAAPHAAEEELWTSYRGLGDALSVASAAGDYRAAFNMIASFAPKLAEYFVHVFVMADDQALKENRLRMLRAVRDACSTVAHFQLLQG